MKVVIDTNVFISGIFWKGSSNKVLELWKRGTITLVVSSGIIDEIIKVLSDFKIQLPPDAIKSWINMILKNSILVEPKEKLQLVKDDPSDNKFIEAAFASNAQYIISQDKHLIKLKEFKGLLILTPEELIAKLS